MNSALLLATLLVSTTASAMPAIKDFAKYDAVLQKVTGTTTETKKFQLSRKVVDYDEANDLYAIEQTKQYENEPLHSETLAIPGTQLPSDAAVDNILLHCVEAGGTPEKIRVKAGEFDTCRMGAGSSAWLGKVPFGIVKILSTGSQNGVTYTITTELAEFNNGPKAGAQTALKRVRF